ncbi:MAG: ABC transporter ATP-binding protein [Acidimicrobiales bacterium]|nr:ABC transporter ATP-binding protein [Acidimicrobiales bacterium]
MSAVLEARGVSVSFGAVRALAEVDLEVNPGQLVGLIGPNGAGKTTFIDAVTGFVPARGQILLEQRSLQVMSAHHRARLGLARTWQTIELFDDLSVRENLTVATRRSTARASVGEVLLGRPPRTEALAEDALRLLELEGAADKMPTELSQGQRKLVGIARALASKPRLLLLDEPAAGLDPSESRDLGQRLRGVTDAGLPALLVDHDMSLVLGICDYIYVLDFGRLIAEGTPEQVRRDPKVLAAYLGSSAGATGAGGLGGSSSRSDRAGAHAATGAVSQEDGAGQGDG